MLFWGLVVLCLVVAWGGLCVRVWGFYLLLILLSGGCCFFFFGVCLFLLGWVGVCGSGCVAGRVVWWVCVKVVCFEFVL